MTYVVGIFNLVKHFNKITAWVRTEILAQDILKHRVEMVKRFIQLASQLHALKNMNGLIEIISFMFVLSYLLPLLFSSFCLTTSRVSALDSTPIQRLTRTWAGLMPQDVAMFEAFRNIISPHRSYLHIRYLFLSLYYSIFRQHFDTS